MRSAGSSSEHGTPLRPRSIGSRPPDWRACRQLAVAARMRHGNAMTISDSTHGHGLPLDDAIMKVLSGAGGKTLSPPEIATAISGDTGWHDLLAPIRRTAVSLAQDGRIVIYRKGKPVDPSDFRGVYRLGLPRHD
jgi:hypothetical protein